MKADSTSSRRAVLLIEDNPADARLLRELVREAPEARFDMIHAPTLRDGLTRLGEGGIDLVLVDLSLPDSAGLESFSAVQAAAPELPVIVMSGLDDEDLAITTVQQGAQDYLVKGQVDSRLLVRSMHYAIERNRVEKALAQERDLLHTLLDNLPDRIYVKDERSRFLRISKALADMFRLGHPREAWMKSDQDFFSHEHAAEALKDEQRVIRTGEPIIGKVERETLPDGGVRWALTSKLPLRDKKGQTIGTFGLSRDITELKRVEDELQAERNVLRSLIDNLPDYIYVKDLAGRYVLDNVAHQRFLGAATARDVIGKTSGDFFDAAQALMVARDDAGVLGTGQPLLNREEQVSNRQGQARWHSTTKVPLRDGAGHITGLVGIARDITERKEQEEKLRQAHAELQQSHHDLKAAQFQLIQAEKMQSVGRLAAGVAHEVKNPLAILRMGIDYFADNAPSGDQNAALVVEDMKEAIKRADAIILGLLDFSVPAALHEQPCGLGELAEETLLLVRHEMTAPYIQVVREFAADVPPVRLDRNKMKQVLVNLLTNAIHAMPEGGALTLSTFARRLQEGEVEADLGSRAARNFHAGDRVAVLQITDTGKGIPEEILQKVFDPFFTTKPTGKGTGLGLTVTRKIIELHGGTIDLRNREEGGVRVTLVFKLPA